MPKQNKYDAIDWDKIARYHAGEMTAEQLRTFMLETKNNIAYTETLNETKADLDAISQYMIMEKNYNTDDAWNSVSQRIETYEKDISNKTKQPKSLHFTFGKVAAIALALVAFSFTAYLIHKNTIASQNITIAAINQQGKLVTLPDGTIVTLNEGSEISYPKVFTSNQRDVIFRGEGFFNVSKNANKPFVIHTEKAAIKVLGTSFNVQTSSVKTEVLVATGKVQLSKNTDYSNAIVLMPGDLGTLENNHLSKTILTDENYLSWKTKQMVFNDTPLYKVARILEKTYSVKIEITNDTIGNQRFTSTYEHEPLNIVLESIGKSFNLTYERDGRLVVFKTR